MNFAAALGLFLTLQGTALAESPAVGESAPANGTVLVVVDLSDGTVLRGTMPTADARDWKPGAPVSITLDDGKTRLLASDQVANIYTQPSPPGPEEAPSPPSQMIGPRPESALSPKGYSFANIGKSRHLYAPSAIGLKQGEGYFSQKLLFSAVAVGVTDHVTLLAGTFTLFPPLLTIVGGKVGGQVAPNVHLAAGGEVFIIGIADVDTVAKVGFGGLTLGHEDSQVTISSGYMSVFDAPAVPLMVAAQHRFGRRSVLVTENWFVMGKANRFAFMTAAYRLLGRPVSTDADGEKRRSATGSARYSVDFGMITMLDGQNSSGFIGPLPWVDFAWHFDIKD